MEMWPSSGMWSKAFQSMKMFHAATSEIWDGQCCACVLLVVGGTHHNPVGFHHVDFGCRLEGNLVCRPGDAAAELQLIVVDAGLGGGGQPCRLLEQGFGGLDQVETRA